MQLSPPMHDRGPHVRVGLLVGDEVNGSLAGQQAHGRQRSGEPGPPQTSKLLQLETQVIHIDLGCYKSVTPQTGCSQTATPENSPSMRVWPGLKIPKGVFVAVAE